jgi:hypothetical protein
VSTKMAVFWVVAPCSLVEVYRRFRGPCCLHHQVTHRPDDGGIFVYLDVSDRFFVLYDEAFSFLGIVVFKFNCSEQIRTKIKSARHIMAWIFHIIF